MFFSLEKYVVGYFITTNDDWSIFWFQTTGRGWPCENQSNSAMCTASGNILRRRHFFLIFFYFQNFDFQSIYMGPIVSMLMAGVLPFGAVFIELFFIFGAIWENEFYYLFGFLFMVFLILALDVAQIAVVMAYFQLCSEGMKFWDFLKWKFEAKKDFLEQILLILILLWFVNLTFFWDIFLPLRS